MNKISIIVPCFNEEEVLMLFYKEVTKELSKIENITYEFIFINDGSSDHTIDILKDLSLSDSHCKYYSFSRNFGKEAGMFAGLNKATGDYCVIMDADLQHPPHLLKDMYHAVSEEGYDCCAGFRKDRKGENKVRSFLSKEFYKVISKMCKFEMNDGAGDYRMMNRVMVNSILEMKEYNRYMKGIYSFVGFDTKWIPFTNVERAAGKTKWNLKSLFQYAMEGILSFTTMPLTISAIFGIIFLGLSFILFVYMFTMFLTGNAMKQWIGITTLIFMLSGIQMISIALLGQYISKDYMENKNRPIYIIKESSDNL